MIDFQSVSKSYQQKDHQVKAIQNISLRIKRRESFGIIGESGAGKSTLLHFINALERPDQGEVFVNGQNLNKLSTKDLRRERKKISMIFQGFNLLENKTVAENIQLPLRLYDYEKPLKVSQVLDFVSLTDKSQAYPKQLSGGEKQRVGIARALISRPEILLADEPTSSLDTTTSDEIVRVLKKAHEEFEMTVVTVSHDLKVIKNLADRAAILESGKLTDVIAIEKQEIVDTKQSYREKALEVFGGV